MASYAAHSFISELNLSAMKRTHKELLEKTDIHSQHKADELFLQIEEMELEMIEGSGNSRFISTGHKKNTYNKFKNNSEDSDF